MNYCLFTQKNDKIPGTSLYAVLLYESVEETEKMKLYSASPFVSTFMCRCFTCVAYSCVNKLCVICSLQKLGQ